MKNFCCSRIQNPARPSTAFLNASRLLLSTISSTVVCSLYEYKWACLHSMAALLISRLRKACAQRPTCTLLYLFKRIYSLTSSPTTILRLSRQISHQEKKLHYLESRAGSMPPNSTYVRRGNARRCGIAIGIVFNATLFTQF
jgi:hypothetical protein